MKVRERQQMIAGTIYAMMMLRLTVQEPVDTANKKQLSKAIGILSELLNRKIRIVSQDEIKGWIEECSPLGVYSKYLFSALMAVSAAQNNMASFEDMVDWEQESKLNVQQIPAVKLAAARIRQFPDRVSIDEVKQLLLQSHSPASLHAIVLSALEADVPGITKNDILEWVNMFAPVVDGEAVVKKGDWALYQKLAMTAIKNSQYQEAGIILDWVSHLSSAGEYTLAGELILAAYEKSVTGIGIESVADAMDIVAHTHNIRESMVTLSKGALSDGADKDPISEPIALIADAVEKCGELFSPDAIIEWDRLCSGGEAFANSSHILVRGIAKKQLFAHVTLSKKIGWVDTTIELARQKGMPLHYRSAGEIAASLVDAQTEGITAEVAQKWVETMQKQGHLAEASPLLRAMVRQASTMGVSVQQAESWMKILVDIGEGYGDVGISIIQSDVSVSEDTIKSWITALMRGDEKQRLEGSHLLIAALHSGRITVTREEISGWGNQLAQMVPVKAVELGLEARELDVPIDPELINLWQAACYEGKNIDSIVKNAIMLIELFRQTPAYAQTPTASTDVDVAFRALLEGRENLGISEETPVQDALAKIQNWLFT